MIPKLIVLVAITSLLSGCPEVAAFRAGIAQHGAEAADQTLETAIWTMCQGSSIGAISRRFKTEGERNAYGVICSHTPP